MTVETLNTRQWNGLTIPTPGKFNLDPKHTRVGFVARHMMISKVRGAFGVVSGDIEVAEDPAQSTVNVTIETASIHTATVDRDNHLRSPDFLDVQRFPSLTFRSTGLTFMEDNSFVLHGELTIRDVTRPISLEATFEGISRSPYGEESIGFSASADIDREEFGMTWNQVLETGGVLVGRKVKLEIEAEAVRQG